VQAHEILPKINAFKQYYKKFNSPSNGSTMKKIDRERQYTTERTSKH